MKRLALLAAFAAVAAFAVDASQGVRKAAGCRAEWDGAWLKVSNAMFLIPARDIQTMSECCRHWVGWRLPAV